MPIEIRELVIRAVVDESGHSRAGEAPGEEERARLVQTCVDEVLRTLRRRRER